MTIRYRVYDASEIGSVQSFCGEFDTLTEAQAFAETEPAGLPEPQWESVRQGRGQGAPDQDGQEEDEPISWHGKTHCVNRVTYS